MKRRRPATAPADTAAGIVRRGLAAHQAGRLDEAAGLYERALKAAPADPDALHLLGVVRLQKGDAAAAAELVGRATALKPASPIQWNNLGAALRRLGRAAEAEAAFRRAVALKPAYAEAQTNLGALLRESGRPEAAEAALAAALKADPGHVPAHWELGKALQDQNRVEAAADAFRRAAALSPKDAAPRASLAALAERASRLDEARTEAAAALALDPANALARLVAARCDRRQDRPQDGLALLAGLDLALLDDEARAGVLYEKGMLHDRLREYADAYAAFAAANAAVAATPRARAVDRAFYPDRIAALKARFTPEWIAGWTPPVADDRPPPVFLVGFPRSGTTLLDQILNAHPGLVTMEEKPAVDAVVAEVARLPGGYPDALAGLGADDVRRLRAVYWAEAARHAAVPEGARLVDKMPLNATEAGLIHRLFPGAPFLLALRHPCDAVLSGFMQAFRPNPAMIHFLTLADTARFYAAVMSLWRQYAAALPLAVLATRYEDMVADQAAETRRILDFLGLPWDDAVLRFADKARARAISTPSYAQVVQPIYGRSVNRWRNYAPWFGEALASLRPFLAAFGYEAAP